MDINRLARVMKALSHPNRLELYLEIARQNEASFPACAACLVSEIAGRLQIGPSTISHHLKELSDVGLITTQRRGKYLVAMVDRKTLQDVGAVLSLKKE